MSKCVVYQSGGFTNDGIGYRKFSLEELEEMKSHYGWRSGKRK